MTEWFQLSRFASGLGSADYFASFVKGTPVFWRLTEAPSDELTAGLATARAQGLVDATHVAELYGYMSASSSKPIIGVVKFAVNDAQLLALKAVSLVGTPPGDFLALRNHIKARQRRAPDVAKIDD